MTYNNFCPIENTEVLSNGKFCHKDGAVLIEPPFICLNGHPCNSYEAYCPHCGEKVGKKSDIEDWDKKDAMATLRADQMRDEDDHDCKAGQDDGCEHISHQDKPEGDVKD